jgi:hypothetical protein
MPIVLSANLFSWFGEAGSVTVILVAVVSRSAVRRGNRHVFNPSVAGLTVASILALFSSRFAFDAVFDLLPLAPNMSELILLLAILPQLKFPIALVSVGSVIGLEVSRAVWGPSPSAAFPTMILAFALLATDPATIPETQAGRLLFGLFVGNGLAMSSWMLKSAHYTDEFSKVYPIFIANALVPWFDRLGRAATARWRLAVLAPRWNLAHMGLWFVLVSWILYVQKPLTFQPGLHWTYGTPLVTTGARDYPSCADNPTFCRPFTFTSEVSLWMHMARSTGGLRAEK